MQGNELLKRYTIGEKDFNQTTLSEVKVAQTQPDGGNLSNVVLLGASIYFVMGWAILCLMVSIILTVARTEIITLERLHQLPCRNCQFFSRNPYLKCAVHPCIALTEKASNCSDYLPQKRKFFH
ncbi:MAG TPA: hypothetical protein DEV81_23825 [Cyanobacteria bacterium UBA11049]|nr:hypothetical protein [Cyanobacteria bacterium UBA11049]